MNFEIYLEVCGWGSEFCFGAANFTARIHLFLSVVFVISLSISLCRDIIHVHYRAENFEPYLSQVLKIRWEDELGRKNPLADKEYRYFLLV